MLAKVSSTNTNTEHSLVFKLCSINTFYTFINWQITVNKQDDYSFLELSYFYIIITLRKYLTCRIIVLGF